jgi:hypothetical protein
MSTKINVRSPYYAKVPTGGTSAALNSVTLSLFVWTGETTDIPATGNYTFTKYEIADSNYVVFELSEYIKDFLVTEYGNYSTDIVWVKYSYVIYNSSGGAIFSGASANMLAVDGYTNFEDGVNAELSKQLLQSNTIIYYNSGQDIVFPIWAEDLSTITLTSDAGADVLWEAVEDFWNTYDVSWGYALTPINIDDTGFTDQKIQYVRLTASAELQDGDTITIASTTGGGTTVITLEEIEECKYTPMNVIFYNKFGALQNIWFFKKAVNSLSTTSESYKANIMDFSGSPVTYSTSSPQYQIYNKNGKERISMNTGFIDEQYNEVIKQLMLSEQVWIDNGTNVLPVSLNSNSLSFKTSVNDKLIDYTLEFEYAFDKINTIR